MKINLIKWHQTQSELSRNMKKQYLHTQKIVVTDAGRSYRDGA